MQETINRQRKKRGMATLLILFKQIGLNFGQEAASIFNN